VVDHQSAPVCLAAPGALLTCGNLSKYRASSRYAATLGVWNLRACGLFISHQPDSDQLVRNEYNIRRGTAADIRAAFDVSMLAVKDLFVRQGIQWSLEPEQFWAVLEPYLVHLSEHAAEWWVAEDRANGELIGYGRSVERGGLFELSELFVHPARQSAGLGKALLDKAFPSGRGELRVILATNDRRGLARYYGAGTVARFAMFSLTGQPRRTEAGALEVVSAGPADINELAAMERAVVGYARSADYPWLLKHREIYKYRRAGRTVGFGCFSETGQGPIVALEPDDQPEILLHVESLAADRGMEDLSFEVPSVNAVVMHHLLERHYKIDSPSNLLMSSKEFGRFDRFVAFAPSIVL
jgi:GNAT superfamily N-acetyltransferase